MVNNVEFPGLGLDFALNRVAFTLFGMDIYWYGLCIGLGMALALVYAFSQSKRFGVDADRMVDVVMIGLVCAIVGGRAYYVFFTDYQYTTFLDAINLRNGGIAIYGAIIGAFLGAALACRWRKVPVLPLFDMAGVGFLIGQCLGRWGNFFNQEAFGTNTTLPWGMRSQNTIYYLTVMQEKLALQGKMVDPMLPVHPTFLYESLWCALGFLLLFLYRKHRRFNGEMFLFYVIWYGAGRFVIEGLRTDALMLSFVNFPASQALAALSVVGGLVIWAIARRKTRGVPLKVPALPPRTSRVKLETGTGPATVVVSWPAGEKEPSREEKLAMARRQLEADADALEKDAEDAPAEKGAERGMAEDTAPEGKADGKEGEPAKAAQGEGTVTVAKPGEDAKKSEPGAQKRAPGKDADKEEDETAGPAKK